MSKGFHCLGCGADVIVGSCALGHNSPLCTGHVIPIATICNPPEPTVIEASDLAPGMVATLCHQFDGPHLVDPGESIWFWFENVDIGGNHRLLEFVDSDDVCFVAGGRGRT